MSKEMVISANPHETRVAILEEGQLCEYYVEREKEFALVGSIYKGRVTRVLPGMQSAFVEIGLDSDAFLYVSDFLEGIEEFDDHVATAADDKIRKMEEQGGRVFPVTSTVIPALESPDVDPLAEAPAESLADAGAARAVQPAPAAFQSPSVAPIPMNNTASPDRPRYENRGRGGRDSGRRDRGGRSGGRFGKRDRGGRSGPPRYGRELPSAKYASSGASDYPAAEGATAEGHVSVILPGESFAKYREKPDGSTSAMSAPDVSVPEQTHASAFESSAAPTVAPPVEYAAHAPAESNVDAAANFPDAGAVVPAPIPTRAPYQPAAFGGLEPLPGESLAKFRKQEAPAASSEDRPAPPVVAAIPELRQSAPEAAAPAEVRENARHEAREILRSDVREEEEVDHLAEERSRALAQAESVLESLAGSDLSEDEADALAEHVAEAQSDDAERDAQERSFDAVDEGPETGDADSETDTEGEAHSAGEELNPAEEHELEDEEADAEAEGMIAPAEGIQSEDREHADAISASGTEALAGEEGSSSPGNSLPQAAPSSARIQNNSRARMQQPNRRGGRDRGRRPQQGHSHGGHSHHRTQPHRPQLIADMLKQGQEIIVQIAKEPLGKKGARITSHIALPGRYLVYMPTLNHSGVSRKIASAEERSRLRHLVNDAKGASGGGFIVRTAAATAPPEDVRTDVEFLTRTWSEIKSRSEQRKAPSILHRDLNLVERMLRDHMSSDYGAIWVDTEEEYTKVVDFMSRFQPALVNRVRLYTKTTPVFEEFGIQQEIDKGLRPKVWLKSGGYIVINHTEALVAIDVNTGKFVGKGSNRLEDTIVRTNIEAVSEIVRQMRLRDLGGIIIIDFIDMEERRNREKVMAALEDALKADRAPSKMLRFNEFGLIAITRKRTKQALERTLCQPCPYCTGSGMVKSIATLCYEIQTEARKMAADMNSGSITLRVHPEISKAFKTRESSLIEELESWTKKSIIIQADPTLHWEQYDIY